MRDSAASPFPPQPPQAFNADSARWGPANKLLFRFGFSYLVMYCFPFPLGVFPYLDKADGWYQLLWQKMVPWVAQHILRISQPVNYVFNGSGDKLYDWVMALCMLALAIVAAVVWSALDRNRGNYARMYQWLRLYVRLTLGSILLAYGAYKVVPSQFPAPFLWRYLQTFGASSPMGILWTFMGASKAYTIMAGAVEMLAGTLLYVPRLQTLGALVAVGTMGNVFVLNMCYDVPVKLYSGHLLLFSCFLLLPEMRRLSNVFIFNRAAEPAAVEVFFQRKWLARGLLAAQLLVGLWCAAGTLYQSQKQVKSFTVEQAHPPELRGFWAVDEFVLDGQALPPLITDETRWQKLIFDLKVNVAIQKMDSSIILVSPKIETDKKSMVLNGRGASPIKINAIYQLPSKDAMLLDGDYSGKKLHVKLHRIEPVFLLNTRGFHWVNPFPMNR